jgi:CrcB protein
MTLISFLAVGCGAFIGACLRYLLALTLTPVFPTIPLGTLAANLLGGFLMGLVLGLFAQFQTLPPEWRLLVATGFLGGLTTFSAFSAETVSLLLRQQYAWAAGAIGLHLVGTLAMTLIGFGLVEWLLRMPS